MDWKQPEKIATIEGSDYGKPASVSEIVRASVQLPTQNPTPYSESVKTPRQQFKPKVARSVAAPKPRTVTRATYGGVSNQGKSDQRVMKAYAIAVKALSETGNETSKDQAFRVRMSKAAYFHASDLIKRGVKLPLLPEFKRLGITSNEILNHLLKTGQVTRAMVAKAYSATDLGSAVERSVPAPVSRARRTVEWFTANSSVPAAFTRRAGENTKVGDCRKTLCPDNPDDCPECDELEEKHLRNMLAGRQDVFRQGAVIIKSNTGGIRARTDGNPVRFNSLGVRIR